MKKLLSLPPNLVDYFHEVEHLSKNEYFCTNDPIGEKLGSGGGTIWLLKQCFASEEGTSSSFNSWLAKEKRILLHAGGQSRRLPAYAPVGKILTPIPSRNNGKSSNLLQIQLPLYEQILQAAPENLHTLIASGDVCIMGGQLQSIPDADVICYGIPVSPYLATNHGVFLSRKDTPSHLDFMLQKPSVETIDKLSQTHEVLMDIGIWLLSDRAVNMLSSHTERNGKFTQYDLYGEFGCALGQHPSANDPDISKLTVAILPLNEGKFLHFGTTPEMISSSLTLCPQDSSIIIQNSHVECNLPTACENIWIENSWIGEKWNLSKNNVLTGIPQNEWDITLQEGICVDVIPIGEDKYALRPYGIKDKFRGSIKDDATTFLNQPVPQWLASHNLAADNISGNNDLQSSNLFPLSNDINELGLMLEWFLTNDGKGMELYHRSEKISADAICEKANMLRLQQQRLKYCHEEILAELTSYNDNIQTEQHVSPRLNCEESQSVKCSCPVRIDLAGGWTDTPPFCITDGGNVVNIAVELDGKAPLQTVIKRIKAPQILLHSMDFHSSEIVDTYEELAEYTHVGSPFSIPKAALALAGFHPQFCGERYSSLQEQLLEFGSGIELTLSSDLPAGSGMGTSSILASTVLGALNEFCSLEWDIHEICSKTLLLEQMLTTGGGWQDQYGGILHGVKLLRTEAGVKQTPQSLWLPDKLFTSPETSGCHVLYYTGLTRTAKKILSEIVQKMYDFDPRSFNLLNEMKQHAIDLAHAIQNCEFETYGRLIAKTWAQNKALDSGTNPPEVEHIIKKVEDLCLGYKLPGAGGGGFLYMVAKDQDAAKRIRRILTTEQPNSKAHFVDMNVSEHGLHVEKS